MKSELEITIAEALTVIAPNWPLDRQIAVNPWWGWISRRFDRAAMDMGRLLGSRFALAHSEYLRAWHAGEIAAPALMRALAESGAAMTLYGAVAALQTRNPSDLGMPLPSDCLDEQATRGAEPRWSDTITQQVSQYCAAYFDEHQADWHRGQAGGLYWGWHCSLEDDHALAPLMQAPQIRSRLQHLPDTADEAISWSLDRLGVSAEHAKAFMQVCLLRINGWASWCAYLGWEAGLRQTTDTNLRELLAIRMAWEALLFDESESSTSVLQRWRVLLRQASGGQAPKPSPVDLIWQRAQEISYQDRLISLLTAGFDQRNAASDKLRRTVQLVFCIDVRSERYRRALEDLDPTIETLGFAGFFGLPIGYTPIGTAASRPQLPGLLAPDLAVTDSTGNGTQDELIAGRRQHRLRTRGIWQLFQRLPSGAFTLVETLGLGYAINLLRRHWVVQTDANGAIGLNPAEVRRLGPYLCLTDHEGVARKADLVASALKAMSLTKDYARLLVFVGHGSQSANNPQAASLECGACGGHSGEINARVLAGLCNDPAVREALGERGIDLPVATVAVAALHNTTTDEMTLFDGELVPATHTQELTRLRTKLEQAGHKTRVERAASLGLEAQSWSDDTLLKQFRRRARDWAETRPEWGLADNAAFIVAPRSRTRGLNLAGRSFLHDYQWQDDQDGAVLEAIMTAPMIVTHWINLQYFASTVDPLRYGSGNKVLHNVACGRIGVFEGNTGDLRVGLARQSLHDGEQWRHTPLRLSVVIDAPQAFIDTILARHETVRHLVEHQWLYLFRYAGTGFEWHHHGRWQPWMLDQTHYKRD